MKKDKKVPCCDCRTVVYYQTGGLTANGEEFEPGDVRYAGVMEQVEVDKDDACVHCGYYAVYISESELGDKILK